MIEKEDKDIVEHEKMILQSLKIYYEKYFDMEMLSKLLNDTNFETREFGFIRRDDKRMYRNKSFKEPKFLREYLVTFPVNHGYIGAVYEDRVMPAMNYNQGVSIDQTKWIGRELTFDLDLTDYDEVRECNCVGRDFCEICWTLMQDAYKIVDDTLRNEFGFEDIVWIFSGGRGYHAWVLDKIVYDLSEEQRKSIVAYIQLIYTTVNYEKIEDIDTISIPLRNRIYRYLVRNYFLDNDVEYLMKLNGIGKKTIENVKEKLTNLKIPERIIPLFPKQARNDMLEVIIRKRYPRLDGAVTEGHNHLIRLPGSVHMGTGYITQIVDKPDKFQPHKDGLHFLEVIGKNKEDFNLK